MGTTQAGQKGTKTGLTHTGAVVAGELEARFTLAGKRARGVDTAVLAVAIPTLIDVCGKAEQHSRA